MVWGLPALPPYLFSSFVRVHEEFVAHKLVEVIVGAENYPTLSAIRGK